MEKPDMEWIDKIFNCLKEFYGERWTKRFDRWTPEDLVKTIWQSALTGLTYDEIRGALVLLKQSAKTPGAQPPHHLEFFRFAKGTSHPVICSEHSLRRGNPDIARAAMEEINAKLRYKSDRG